MSDTPVDYKAVGNVGIARFDDGKVNALSYRALDALNSALDQAERDAEALVLVGRPGKFSAGFDLSVMRQGVQAATDMVKVGAELALRLYAFPCPVVAACSGHAIAMGSLLLLACDSRIGITGDFKIGLNEVSIGMPLPVVGIELARDRLSPRHVTRAVLEAEIYSPEGAVEAGFLDRVIAPDALDAEALSEAQRLAGLDTPAHHATKKRMRQATIDRIRQSLTE
ncbi:MAG: crotonase/enoyl-CoA hydratase family protein [Proteobacteria bacterium]|nr:crotonase/enoyl-CoA hydratase family protein [Pseudomonadota bacterium]